MHREKKRKSSPTIDIAKKTWKEKKRNENFLFCLDLREYLLQASNHSLTFSSSFSFATTCGHTFSRSRLVYSALVFKPQKQAQSRSYVSHE